MNKHLEVIINSIKQEIVPESSRVRKIIDTGQLITKQNQLAYVMEYDNYDVSVLGNTLVGQEKLSGRKLINRIYDDYKLEHLEIWKDLADASVQTFPVVEDHLKSYCLEAIMHLKIKGKNRIVRRQTFVHSHIKGNIFKTFTSIEDLTHLGDIKPQWHIHGNFDKQVFAEYRLKTNGVNPLTDRERELLKWFSEDLTTPQLAEKLHISTHTLYTHRKNILNKLECSTMLKAFKFATEQGLL